MDDELANSQAALDATIYAERLRILDARYNDAKAAEAAVRDMIANAKATAAEIIGEAKREGAALIMEAEQRAERVKAAFEHWRQETGRAFGIEN